MAGLVESDTDGFTATRGLHPILLFPSLGSCDIAQSLSDESGIAIGFLERRL